MTKLFLPLDPRTWPALIHNVRVSDGAAPALFPIAILGTIAFGSGLLLRTSPFMLWFFCGWLTPWLVISSIGAALALLDSLLNISSRGLTGFSRCEQWFEVSRASMIAVALASVILVISIYAESPISEFALFVTFVLLSIFFATACVRYVLSVFHRSRPRGQAYQCVDFFFLQLLAGLVMVASVVAPSQFFDQLQVVFSTATIAATGAVMLTTLKWRRSEFSTTENYE